MSIPNKEAGLLENLVTQFSSSLDCFRELVQNALDAGSPSVDVWMEFERGQDHVGVISIHVDDYGEGMDEAIIENQLTKLFSSTKENDLTKIGKFGIGFVSVFAMNPKGVLVKTGRGGQYWEVFFYPDRSFAKTPVEDPCEGTQITLFIEGDYRRYRELAEGVRATLKRWCEHADHEITFEDRSPQGDAWSQPELINEPFDVPGVCKCAVSHQGTEILVAYTHTPLYGLYNRGLTLAIERLGENILDHRAARYRHIAFKIKSRYLEHTLSRETVVRDANYEKAMSLVDDAVNGPLLNLLCSTLEELAATPQWGHEQVVAYLHLLSFLVQEPNSSLVAISERPILRLLSGGSASLSQLLELYHEQGRLLVADHRSALVQALAEASTPVLFGHPPASHVSNSATALWNPARLFVRFAGMSAKRSIKGKARQLVSWAMNDKVNFEAEVIQALSAPEAVYLPVTVDGKPPAELAPLIQAAQALLKDAQTPYRRLTTCTISSPGEDVPLFVVAPKLSSLMSRPPKHMKDTRIMEAAVNRDHHHVKLLLRMYQQQPHMAAYCMAKDLLLVQDRHLELDQTLMSLARAL